MPRALAYVTPFTSDGSLPLYIAVIIIKCTWETCNFQLWYSYGKSVIISWFLFKTNSWSYIGNSDDFIDKIERIGIIPAGCLLETFDVVGLYPSIPQNEGFSALKQKLEEQPPKKIPSNDLVTFAKFVVKNSSLKFKDKVKQ